MLRVQQDRAMQDEVETWPKLIVEGELWETGGEFSIEQVAHWRYAVPSDPEWDWYERKHISLCDCPRVTVQSRGRTATFPHARVEHVRTHDDGPDVLVQVVVTPVVPVGARW